MVDFDRAGFRARVLGAIEVETDYRDIERVVREQREAGAADEALIEELTALMLELRAQDRDDDEDVVGELLDYLTGW